MSTTQDTFHLIVNPVSGHGKGEEFANQTIIPILKHLSIPHQVHTTSSPGDAGNIAQTILSSQKEGTVVVGIVGGDGTFHEFMGGVSSQEVRWEVVLFPYGTANALYSSLFPPSSTSSTQSHQILIDTLPSALSLPESKETLSSLSSFFSYLSKSTPVYLPITKTTLSSIDGQAEELHSHVVLSTSLHAAILEDSERLRATHPGTERFKIAAQENASRLFYASVTLYSEGGAVEQWDARKGEWIRPYTITEGSIEEAIEIQGPFSYFLSTSTVDRLEPSFVISPLTTLKPTKPNDKSYIYMTVIRPSRDPLITSSTPSNRKEVMSKRAFEVVGNAYSNGNHVNLTFPPREKEKEKEGYELEIKGEGEPVVEVYRCSSFEWQPSTSQGKEDGLEGLEKGNARLVCADGALHTIPEGGVARVGLEGKKENGKGFYVFA